MYKKRMILFSGFSCEYATLGQKLTAISSTHVSDFIQVLASCHMFAWFV